MNKDPVLVENASNSMSWLPASTLFPQSLKDLNFTYSSDDGKIVVQPSCAQMRDFLASSWNGLLTIDVSADVSTMKFFDTLVFRVNPIWFVDSLDCLLFQLQPGVAVQINVKNLRFTANNSKGQKRPSWVTFTLEFHQRRLRFSITQNGKEISWYDYHNGLLVTLPYQLGINESEDYVVMNMLPGHNQPQYSRCLPRSGYEKGIVWAKAYQTGVFHVQHHFPPEFVDTQEKWLDEAVNYLTTRQVITRRESRLFQPDQPVTRAEFTTMLIHLFAVELPGRPISAPFADQAQIPLWAVKSVNQAADLEIIHANLQGNFQPNQPLTRQDMLAIGYRALNIFRLTAEAPIQQWIGFNDWEQVADYAGEAIQNLARMQLVNGYLEYIYPKQAATRAEAAQFLYNILRIDRFA